MSSSLTIFINNFKCYEKSKFEFLKEKDNKIFFIEGKNGSGKSTLLESIVWCLCENYSLKGNFIKPFKKSNEATSVKIHYFHNNEKDENINNKINFIVERKFTKNNTSLTLEDKIKDTFTNDPQVAQNFINKFFDKNIMWYLKQSFPCNFLTQSNTEKYETLYNYFFEDEKVSPIFFINKFKTELKEKKNKLDKYNYFCNNIKKPDEIILNSNLIDVKKYLKITEKYSFLKDLSKNDIEYYIENEESININKKYSHLKFITNYTERNIKLFDKINEVLRTNKLSKKSFLKAFENSVKNFYKNTFKKCPKCNEMICFNDDKETIEFIENYLKSKNPLTDNNSNLNKLYKLIEEFDIEDDKTIVHPLIDIYTELKKEHFHYNEEYNINDLREYLNIDLTEEEKKITLKNIFEAENYKEEDKEIKNKIEKITKKIENLEYLFRISLEISKSVINSSIENFEKRINKYLAIFKTNFKVCLTVETQKNLNSIKIEFSNSSEDKFENPKFLSGGEYNKFNIALSLAFQNSKIIIFDETLNCIDEEFKEKILRELKKETFFEYLFFVSHSNISGGYYDKKICLD